MKQIIIFCAFLGISSAAAVAQTAPPIQLADNAPDSHVVQRGDTLWGISAKFLKEPWRWPELWRLNRDQVRNPHRIYPGQVLVLDRSAGRPALRLGRVVKLQPKVYEEPSTEPVSSIPQKAIDPYLSEPLVVEADGMADAPKVIATQEDRVMVGAGNIVYVAGMKGQARTWQVYRPLQPIVDPISNETLGYEAFFLGSARLLREGEPATLEIVNAKQEIARGDRLLPAERPEIVAYAPHAPDKQIEGNVITIYGGVGQTGETGRGNIVTINRGKRDGIEVGHVLALYRKGRDVEYREDGVKELHKLPEERYGLVFVFRTFDRVAYALVMDAERPVIPQDILRTP